MLTQVIENRAINGKYRVVFEQSAVKGVLGFKIEANNDDLSICETDATALLEYARGKSAYYNDIDKQVKPEGAK